jgi:hypothetical protein
LSRFHSLAITNAKVTFSWLLETWPNARPAENNSKNRDKKKVARSLPGCKQRSKLGRLSFVLVCDLRLLPKGAPPPWGKIWLLSRDERRNVTSKGLDRFAR